MSNTSFARSALTSTQAEETRAIRVARDLMHEGKEPDSSLVRPVIVESWRRCRDAGVDPSLTARFGGFRRCPPRSG